MGDHEYGYADQWDEGIYVGRGEGGREGGREGEEGRRRGGRGKEGGR